VSTANVTCEQSPADEQLSAGPQPEPADAPRPRARATGPARYVYCIIDCDEPADFGPMGIGDDRPEVLAIACEGIAAVVSASAADKYEISRGNVLAHQRVMEVAMRRGYTVLPVRFNTIAEDRDDRSAERRIVENVLTARLDEFSALLSAMSGCVELGVKGLWTDMEAVFGHLARTNEQVRSLRDRLLAAQRGPSRLGRGDAMAHRVKLGELVKNALEAKKIETRQKLTAHLRPLVKDLRENETFGDAMFANLAILVEKDRHDEVASRLSAFEAERSARGERDESGQVKLRCVGPVPPSNFIELVITWDD